jgi:hypothetical protein
LDLFRFNASSFLEYLGNCGFFQAFGWKVDFGSAFKVQREAESANGDGSDCNHQKTNGDGIPGL